MKRMKKILSMLVVLSLMIISMPQDTFAAIKINKSSITLNKSQSYSLKISGTKKSVSWTSSNTSVATVTSKGVVKAKKKGTCKITAKVGKTKYYCDVVVKQPVTDIELSKKNISLSKGKSIKLNVTVMPVSANNKKIIWSSSNSKVARVSADGVVTAVKKGEVTITAKSSDGSNKKATCKVKVTESTNKSEVKDGIYIIESAVNSNYVIDVDGKKTDDGANIHLWQKNSSNNQCFIIKKVTGDYYKIIAKHSGKAVDVCGGSKEPNINIWQWSWNGTNAQLWKFISVGNGYYYIQNKNGMFLV